MRKTLHTRFILLSAILLFAISNQAFAYKLNGVKWAGGSYDYYINPIGVDNGSDYSAFSGDVISAAGAWSSVGTTNVSVNYVDVTSNTEWGGTWPPDYQNTITWKTNGWSGTIIGISTYWYSDGDIIDSDIKLNTSFAADSRLPLLVTHEVGHSLGIGHTRESGDSYTSDEYNSVMYWQLHSQPDLNQQDMCAITAIYPSGSCTPTYAAGYFNCIPCCSGGEVTVDAAISNTVQTYSGTVKSVTVSTTPSGLSHTVTYYQSGNPVTNPTNAGVYDVTVTLTEPGYTDEGPFYGTLTINKKSLSVYAVNKEVDFGSPEPEFTVSYSGFVNGETKSVLNTQPTAYIGGTWPLNPGTYTIFANDGVDDNYSFNYTNGTLTINGLSVNGVSVSDYQYFYDGTNKEISVNIDPEGVGYHISYRLNGYAVTSQINAGTYNITITIDEPGYESDQYIASMTIFKAPLSATADDKNVSFGAPEPTYTITYSGFENGENKSYLDSQPIADVTGTWPLAGGEYPITVTGGNDDNYEINRYNGTLTVTAFEVDSVKFDNLDATYNGLPQLPLISTYPPNLDYQVAYYDEENIPVVSPTNAGLYTVIATITESTYKHDSFINYLYIGKKEIDATANNYEVIFGDSKPAYSINYSGFVNGESVSIIDELPQFDSIGSWPLLPGIYDLNISGGNDKNYYFNLTNGILTVNPAQVDSVNFSGLFYTYDGLNHRPVITTFPKEKTHTVAFFDKSGNITNELVDAGIYNIKAIITEPGYVQDTFSQNLTIQKAHLLATAKDITVNYGSTEPKYIINYSGFSAGEDTSDIDILPLLSVDGTWPLLPGKYPIKLTLGSDSNYVITTKNGTLTVESNKSILTISDTIQVYNGLAHNASINIIPSGIQKLINYFDETGNVVSPPVLPGNYLVKVAITEIGYEPQIKLAHFTIGKARLDVLVDDEIMNYGDTIPDFNYLLSGFTNGETEAAISTLPTLKLEGEQPLLPGNYSIVASGGIAENYHFNYRSGILKVNPLTVLSISVSDTVVIYDGLTHEISVETVPGEIQYAINYFDGNNNPVLSPKNAGRYTYRVTITETGYVNTISTGQLFIQQAQLSVSMDSIELIYGQQAPEIILYYDGFIEGESINELTVLPTPQPFTGWPWNAGKHIIEISGGEAINYAFTYVNGQINIHQATITVIPDDFSILYNDTLPNFTYLLSGFVNGEDESALTKLPSILFNKEENQVQPGSYPLIASGGESVNYTFDYETGNIWVEPLGYVQINISDTVAIYSANAHNVMVDTDPAGLNYRVEYDRLPVDAGNYKVKVTIDEPGYLPQSDSSNVTINKFLLFVKTPDQTMLLGDEMPDFPFEFEGFVNNESIEVIDQLPVAEVNEGLPVDAGNYTIEILGGEDNNYDFTYINGNLIVIQTYQIEVAASENGWVSINGTSTLLDSINERVVINENSSSFYATPKPGFRFTKWNDGNTENPIAFEKVNKNISVTAIFSDPTNVANASNFNAELFAYPNPVKENNPMTLKVILPSDKYEESKIIVTDITGRIISTLENVKQENKISGLPKGVYLLTLHIQNERSSYKKIVVK